MIDANEINETLAELFPRRMFFSVFHEVFSRTKYDKAIEACKDRTTRPSEYSSIDEMQRRKVSIHQRRPKTSLQRKKLES